MALKALIYVEVGRNKRANTDEIKATETARYVSRPVFVILDRGGIFCLLASSKNYDLKIAE